MAEARIEIDNGTTHAAVQHVYKSSYFGERGRDICLETFGEQDEECILYNKMYEQNKTNQEAG